MATSWMPLVPACDSRTPNVDARTLPQQIRCGLIEALLPRGARVTRIDTAPVAAPGVDVQPATAGVAGIHTELGRCAALQHIDEDALDEVLVEVAVSAEADQRTHQAGEVDAWAAIDDMQAAPVRLPGDRYVRKQQARYQNGKAA